jgi:hypothetical protein
MLEHSNDFEIGSSGNHRPSNSFIEFAAKNTRSMIRKAPLTTTTRKGLNPHCMATMAAKKAVIA